MKLLNKGILAACVSLLVLNSCKKTSTDNNVAEIESTFEITGQQAIAENFAEEDNAIVFEATAERGIQGGGFSQTTADRRVTNCATITVTPASGFPKTIVIDFGTGCTANGITRSGKINIVLSDSLRTTGATSVMTFDNYYVNSYKREGTITWKNTSTAIGRNWERTVREGKITAPDGRFWNHNSITSVQQSAGFDTPRNPLDDEFLITGAGSIVNSNNVTRSYRIVNPLLKKVSCANIVSGTKRIEGPNFYAILDFGTGDCDRIATISINGLPPRTILL